MSFSIPEKIAPNFSIPQIKANPINVHAVGSCIKDLELDSETTTKKTHEATVAQLTAKFTEDTQQYQTDLKQAVAKAALAEKQISHVNWKCTLSITLLAISVIGAVGSLIIAATTGLLPIVFIAIPLAIAIIPTGYFSHIFGKAQSALNSDIALPNALIKPELKLPLYNPKKNLELKTTRTAAQEAIASMTTLRQVANTGHSTSDLLNYALLDKMTPISADKRPAFYAKCIRLIKAFGKIVNEKHSYVQTAQTNHDNLTHKLDRWKSGQKKIITSLKSQSLKHRFRYRSPSIKLKLNNKKAEVSAIFSCIKEQNNNRLKDNLMAIKTAFKQAKAQLEAQFTTAKIEAL